MPNKVLGLYVGPNQLEGPQDGAYVSLQNSVIKDKDVIEPRFGVSESTAANFGGTNSAYRVSTIHPSSIGSGFLVAGTGTSTSVFGPLSATAILTNVPAPETWLRNRFVDSRGRCYVTTDTGIYRITSDSAGVLSGGPEPFIGGNNLGRTNYDTSGFLAADYAVCYRAELVRKDPEKREIVGPPSGRAYIRCNPDRTTAVGANGVSRVSNVVTVTTTAAHGYKYGDYINMLFDAADTGAGEFTNGTFIVQSVPTSTTFTYSESAANYNNTVAATCRQGPATVKLTVYLRSDAVAGDILRIYRSEAVTPVTSQPGEDVYQVYEAILTSTDISTGYLVVTDNTPEILLGDPMYVSPSVEGEAGRNDKPPRAVDINTVGGSLVGCNLRYKHSLDLRLIATGGSVGIVYGTTITFTRGGDNFTLTAESNGTVGSGEFSVHSGSTSVASDNERTAQSLVDVINKDASNTFLDAYYISGATEASGMIRLVLRDFTTTAFTVTSDKGAAWSPQILNTGTATTSTQENAVSSVFVSKPGLPDAVPPLSRFEVGEPNEKALRVLPIRDNKAIIIKERSVWMMSGVWPNIRIDLIDDVLTFPLPNTAAVLDGMVYVLSSIGVVAINEGGVASVGIPVSGFTDFLESEELSFTTADAWAATDKALGLYLLFMGTESETDTTSRCLVYSPSTRAWSGPWNVDWTAYGRLISTGLVCVGLPDCPRVANENTGGGDTRGTTSKTVVTSPSATEITFADVSDLSVGDLLSWTVTIGPSSTTRRVVITEINTTTTTVTINVSHLNYFTDGVSTVRVSRGFECIAEPVPLHGGGNGADGHLRDVTLLMDDESFNAATVYVAGGDVGQAYKAAKTLSRWGFGDGTYGDVPWGDYDGIRPERCQVPAESQRAPFHSVRFRIKEAGAKWRLHGIQMQLEPGSVKGRR